MPGGPMSKKPVSKKPVPFNTKLSLQLDRATTLAEKGSKTGKIRKRYIEWKIFGGKDV